MTADAPGPQPPARRIMLITPGFSAGEDDWGIPALRSLAKQLARRQEVRILTLHYPYRAGSYSADGTSVQALGGANVRGVRRAALLGRAVASVVAAHRRQSVDVLHGLWADEAGAVAVTAGRLLGVPAVVSVMGGELVTMRDIGYGAGLSRLGRPLAKLALRRATRVTVGSASLERLTAPNVSPGRLVRAPLGVDTDLFSPADGRKSEGRARLLSVGSLAPVKDHATLLDAFARVPDAELHLVGDGPLRPSLTRQAADLGLSARVTFHGSVRHERLPDHYRAADLLVVSSRYESQAMVALEAAACGCPVVGTAVGVLPELPGAAAVPVGDAEALADAIVTALSDRDGLAARAQASLSAVRAEFALERRVDALCSLYEQALVA